MERIFIDLALGIVALLLGYVGKHLLTVNEIAKMKADMKKADIENQNLKLKYESEIMEALMKSRTHVSQLAEEATALDIMVRKLQTQLHELSEKLTSLIEENTVLKKKLSDLGIE